MLEQASARLEEHGDEVQVDFVDEAAPEKLFTFRLYGPDNAFFDKKWSVGRCGTVTTAVGDTRIRIAQSVHSAWTGSVGYASI